MHSTPLYSLIERSAEAALAQQSADGALPPGHNGPRHDAETPVRNTGHWLITFAWAHRLTGKPAFLQAATQAAAYLCTDAVRPMDAAFWCRTNPEKDFSNGLIGQAWTVEALATAATLLGDERCRALAEKVWLLHPFDETSGLWRPVNVDGSYARPALTFNQEIWFAASGALLAFANGIVTERVRRFLDRAPEHLALYANGLIHHRLLPKPKRKPPLKQRLRERWSPPPRYPDELELRQITTGYHAFNLCGFALLKTQLPDHAFWQSNPLASALNYAQTPEFAGELEANKYAYGYNPVGFELAYALETFAVGASVERQRWAAEQIRLCYDFDAHRMSRNTSDPETLAARIYEATRLPDWKLEL